MVLPALKRGGYSYRKQVFAGARPGGGKHRVDLVAEKSSDEFLISMKWQQSSGSAEQKVPFEIICLAEAIKETPSYKRGYVVLGGPGWTLREYPSRGWAARPKSNSRWVYDQYQSWWHGDDGSSPLWLARVLARFPEQIQNAL